MESQNDPIEVDASMANPLRSRKLSKQAKGKENGENKKGNLVPKKSRSSKKKRRNSIGPFTDMDIGFELKM